MLLKWSFGREPLALNNAFYQGIIGKIMRFNSLLNFRMCVFINQELEN